MYNIEIVLIGLYFSLLLFVFFYSLIQVNLVYHYLQSKKNKTTLAVFKMETPNLPKVTVQLPIYNEKYVVSRLLESVCALHYPKDKLQIQVLDDSTDDSLPYTLQLVKKYSKKGIDICHIHRSNRKGYKAGALAEGLAVAKGEFIAIFDADFVPKHHFLLQSLPFFKDKNIGLVQSRWEHINKNYSLLTKLQAFGLDAHFTVEQAGRNQAGHFINFNGTAGVWRKSCIEDAGGWSSDTLTEDLDLSYRAQLKGWKFKYLEKLGSPAELPAVMSALKTQQFRWTKGAAECAKKNLKAVLLAKNIGITTKVHAVFHLMNSFLFICIICSSLISVPVLILKGHFPSLELVFRLGSFFLTSLVILLFFYWVSVKENELKGGKNFFKFFAKFTLFLSMSMGLSLHNAIAVIQGYWGKKSAFVRTPKMNLVSKNDQWFSNQYIRKNINWITLLEGALCVYFFMALLLAFYKADFGLLPFHLLLCVGFGAVFYYSIDHSIKTNHL